MQHINQHTNLRLNNEIAQWSWLISPFIKCSTLINFLLHQLWPASVVMTKRGSSLISPVASFMAWKSSFSVLTRTIFIGQKDSDRRCLWVFTQSLIFISVEPRHNVPDSVYLKCNLSQLKALNSLPQTQWAGHRGSESITTYKLPRAAEFGWRGPQRQLLSLETSTGSWSWSYLVAADAGARD